MITTWRRTTREIRSITRPPRALVKIWGLPLEIAARRAKPRREDARMSTLWSGRFEGAPDQAVFDQGKSLPVDRRLLDDDIEGSRRVGARAREGWCASHKPMPFAITAGARKTIRAEVHANPARIADADDEDVHCFVERELVIRVGDLGRRVHTGRSRNEQVSLDFRLYFRAADSRDDSSVAELVGAIATKRSAPARLSCRRTRTFAGAARARRAMFSGARGGVSTRCRSVRGRARRSRPDAARLRCDCGRVVRHGCCVSREDSVSRAGANSVDASGDRDFVASFLYACAMAMMNLSRLAETSSCSTRGVWFFELPTKSPPVRA